MKKDFERGLAPQEENDHFFIFIYEEKPVIRDGIRQWLKNEQQYKIISCNNQWEDIFALMTEHGKAILITSIRAVKPLFREIRDISWLKVICFCESTHELRQEKVFDANILGIINYTAERLEFLQCLRNVSEGKLYISTRIMQSAYKDGIFVHSHNDGPATLSKREQEVVTLISLGYSDKEIGELLHLSKRTIDGYRNNLLSKFNARNSAHLIRFAIDNNLLLPIEKLKFSIA
jgi:DNA-binding NarL/FixJ family response regulator